MLVGILNHIPTIIGRKQFQKSINYCFSHNYCWILFFCCRHSGQNGPAPIDTTPDAQGEGAARVEDEVISPVREEGEQSNTPGGRFRLGARVLGWI